MFTPHPGAQPKPTCMVTLNTPSSGLPGRSDSRCCDCSGSPGVGCATAVQLARSLTRSGANVWGHLSWRIGVHSQRARGTCCSCATGHCTCTDTGWVVCWSCQSVIKLHHGGACIVPADPCAPLLHVTQCRVAHGVVFRPSIGVLDVCTGCACWPFSHAGGQPLTTRSLIRLLSSGRLWEPTLRKAFVASVVQAAGCKMLRLDLGISLLGMALVAGSLASMLTSLQLGSSVLFAAWAAAALLGMPAAGRVS